MPKKDTTPVITLDSATWAEIEEALIQNLWQYVLSSSDNKKLFLNLKYMNYEEEYGENLIKSWVKCEYKTYRFKGVNYLKAYSLTLTYFNCYKRQIKQQKAVYYSAGGKVLETKEDDYASWVDIIPDSVGENLLDKACEMIKSKK